MLTYPEYKGLPLPICSNGHKIIAALPSYNEEKYIGTLVLKARQYAGEVIVVDDGSHDQTSKIAVLAGATVIRHDQNQGKGSAIQTIFSEARKRDCDVLILLDADSQHNPDEIPRLIAPIMSGEADIVIGSRTLIVNRTPYYRRFGQKVLLHSTNLMAGQRLSDSESGYRALSRKAICGLDLRENGFAVETEMIVDAARNGLHVREVPVSNIYTDDGSTLNPVRHGMGVVSRILVMVSQRRPLFFFGLVGVIALVVGASVGVSVFQEAQAGNGLAIGSALISMLFILVGVFSIFTGIILNAFSSVTSRER